MRQLRALDLFCGAGGATKGLQKAGFQVTGVDINPQPRYCGDIFIQANAMLLPYASLKMYDFIWASPPCQKYSAATRHLANHKPQLIEPLRAILDCAGVHYCIENTPGAPLRNPTILCGLSFGMNVKRHRLHETTFPVTPIPCVPGHPGDWFVIFGHEVRSRLHGHAAGRKNHLADGRKAMGIDWMTREELSESIPPVYSEYIAKEFLKWREAAA